MQCILLLAVQSKTQPLIQKWPRARIGLRGFMQRYRQEIAAEHFGEETHVLLALHHVSHSWMVEDVRVRKAFAILCMRLSVNEN